MRFLVDAWQNYWYISLALDHYLCYICYYTDTRGERVADTIELFPVTVDIPYPSFHKSATSVDIDLTQDFRNHSPAKSFVCYSDRLENEQFVVDPKVNSVLVDFATYTIT